MMSSLSKPQLQAEEEELESAITTNKTNLLAKSSNIDGVDGSGADAETAAANKKCSPNRKLATVEWILGKLKSKEL